MSKFYGVVGFVKTQETAKGVWESNAIVRREYSGDAPRNIVRYDKGQKVVSDISINNQISIVLDPYALENFQFIKFVEYLGVAWEVSSIDIQYPRLILNLGGVYKGETKNE